MSSMTRAEVKETVKYWETLTGEQKDWVRHKCNWEHMPRPFVLRDYKGHIDSLVTSPHKPVREEEEL